VSKEQKRWIKIIAGPLLGLLVYGIFPEVDVKQYINLKKALPFLSADFEEQHIMAKAAGVAIWMAFWWITEAVSIYVTALIPLFIFPLLGLIHMKMVAPLYMQDVIFLFIGGFLMAYGLERWNLHKRIALKIILMIGATPARILLGFMLASYILSMWILNTAAVTLLLPAVLAVVAQIEAFRGEGKKSKLAVPFLLGLAYAATIGGMATLIGTLPNMVLAGYEQLPHGISFSQWFMFGFPTSIVLFVICYFLLRFMYRNTFREEEISMEFCQKEYRNLGKVKFEEKALGFFFIMTVLLWFFRKDIDFGSVTLYGWGNLLPDPDLIKESTIAMAVAFILLIFPSRSKKGGTLVEMKDIQRLPVGIIFLFGGGFALAKAFEVSGLSTWLGSNLSMMGEWPVLLFVLVLCLGMTFLTELTSNTASTLLILPVIYSLALETKVDPLLLMVPITLSASCAFMLPIATPPNTIVYGSEKLPMKEMMRAGIWLNLIGVIIVTIASFTVVKWVFDI
jgi:sodium-dependent dicarboxylate transporter 2/3/5